MQILNKMNKMMNSKFMTVKRVKKASMILAVEAEANLHLMRVVRAITQVAQEAVVIVRAIAINNKIMKIPTVMEVETIKKPIFEIMWLIN